MFINDGEDKALRSSAFDDSINLGFSESHHHQLQKTDQVQAKNASVRTMTSTSNYGKLFRVKQHCMGGDRITILPDSMLIHILSFLPTKCAVRTCILSTRWKHIWASVPNLHFFFKDRHCSVFADFIDRVLFFHELPCIQRFSLECAGVDLNRLNTWVSVAVRRGVQELHIDVQYTGDCIVLLPPTLFTCTTLVVFKLRSEIQMEILGLVRFPNLRVLHVSLQYPFGDMIQKLFCSSPVLEDFSIGGRVDNSQVMAFDISTVALKKLEMDFYEDQGFEDSDIEFVINAPILEHLTLRDDYFALYRLKNLSSLFRADIDVGCIGFYGLKERANTVYELLKGISSVEYLTLGARTMGALDYADDNNLPLLFPNITHLKLRVCNSSSWKRLAYLLSCMPNLENLVLEVSTKKEFELPNHLNLAAEPNWIEPVPEQTPTCLLLHLKEIGLTGFTSKICHLNPIKYLLENAKVLIKMAISTCNLAVEEEVEFLRHLVTCRRGAQACTIELSRK